MNKVMRYNEANDALCLEVTYRLIIVNYSEL